MPDRSSSRRAIRPFISLPRHRRRSAVIALHGRMLRHAYYTGSKLFDSNQLLIDPEEPDRLHTWVDIVFPGLDRFTLWNAELITTEMAKHDLASSLAHDEMSAKLEAAGDVYESHDVTSHPAQAPRSANHCTLSCAGGEELGGLS
jgi:hypothetical protein